MSIKTPSVVSVVVCYKLVILLLFNHCLLLRVFSLNFCFAV